MYCIKDIALTSMQAHSILPDMSIKEANAPHSRLSVHNAAKGEIALFRTGAEVDLYESLFLESLWRQPQQWVHQGKQYVSYKFPDIPQIGVTWPDGTQQTFLESLAAADLYAMTQSFVGDPAPRATQEEKVAVLNINRPMWQQAFRIAHIGGQALQKDPRQLSAVESAAIDVYKIGTQTYTEQIMIAEGQHFRNVSAQLTAELRRKRVQNFKQVAHHVAVALGKHVATHKGTAFIDAAIFGGVPIATTISTLATINHARHIAAYNAPKLLKQKHPVFYNGNWYQVNYDETLFEHTCANFQRALGNSPLYMVTMNDGRQFGVPFVYNDRYKEAFLQALYLAQPERQKVTSHVGAVFLRQASEIVPRWIWAKAGLKVEDFPASITRISR